jgi:hypothetical protein
LGSKPALSPAETFYHRILSGNCDEEFEQAEHMLKTKSLSSFYDEVAIEGLRLAAIDAHRGALDINSLQKIRTAVGGLVADLSHLVDMIPGTASRPALSRSAELPMAGEDPLQASCASATTVLCIPGPSPLDEVAANILGQILQKHGFDVRVERHQVVLPGNDLNLDDEEVPLVCLSFIDVGDARVRARAAIRRLQRQLPNATVVVGLWGPNKDEEAIIRSQLNAGYYANSFSEAARLCVKGAQPPGTTPAEFTAPSGCNQAQQDSLNDALPNGGAMSMESGGDHVLIAQSSRVNSGVRQV